MEEKEGDITKFLVLAISALVALFGVTYTLLLDRMNKQETIAAADIAALREEIKTTKADAKDAVAAAASASKDAVAATATALRSSVDSTATAARESVSASAAALKDSVNATALSARDATNAIAAALSDKILVLSSRIDKIETRINTKE